MRLSRAKLKRSVRYLQSPMLNKWVCPGCGGLFGYTTPGDLHEWRFKKSDGKPDTVTDDVRNCVLLCRSCHERYGQTKAGEGMFYEYKSAIHKDIDEWIRRCEGGLFMDG